MSDHVIDWLNPYLDDELKGRRLHQVEAHLAACGACREELDALRGVSTLLQELPAPEFTSNERFVSQVNLRLAQRPVRKSGSHIVETGWWLIPIGLLAAWIFFATAVLVSDMVSTADRLGILDGSASLLVSDAAHDPFWSSMLGQLGMLNGESLQWAETTEEITRNALPQLMWQVSIALLYLAWIALWWARRSRHARQPHVGFLEG